MPGLPRTSDLTMPVEAKSLRIAAFGFRSLPPSEGGAGADKFALELLPRLAALGHQVVAYNRVYPNTQSTGKNSEFDGVKVRSFRTVAAKGFDTFFHSLRVTYDIIIHNTADVVHIQNGGNSLFAVFLRLFGKRTYLSQDGLDWEREKWPFYAKIYLRAMAQLTARIHNEVIFDNVFARTYFEKRFNRSYAFVPFGADVDYKNDPNRIVQKLNLDFGEYFLFVGRFIPDKGLQYLIPAFERTITKNNLVLVGGSPNPSTFERSVRKTSDCRILFPGFIYGPDMHALMRHCYAYVQPSDVEGLSPVILESSFLGAPVICSDIEQNKYILGDTGIYFRQGDVDHLNQVLREAIADPAWLRERGAAQRARIAERFSWDKVVANHVEIFSRN
ncbi:glycosyltransferase family 4 protein [Sphingomonas sp. ZB1N12]|uniref:glycosyltransferase family 4 protein n=1 Tax=Sphingomonas arabinosi TaxID=3096160 RepID=UPI002FC5BB16